MTLERPLLSYVIPKYIPSLRGSPNRVDDYTKPTSGVAVSIRKLDI